MIDVLNLYNKVFIVVKPGFLKLSQVIINELTKVGFDVVKTRPKLLKLSEAQRLYRVHQKEDFYKSLCKYMSSDVSIGMLFQFSGEPNEAFERLKKVKDKIREKYSESDMRNVMHSSENYTEMQKEARIYF